MELRKLTKESAGEIADKKLYLFRFFKDYIRDIHEAFPELPTISGVFEPDGTKHGVYSYEGADIPVIGTEHLADLPENSVLIITTGYFREEFKKLERLSLPGTVSEIIYYFANKDTSFYEEYLEKYEDEPLRDLIVFRSGMGTWEHVPGMDFTENSRALFEYMIRNGYNKKYEMVWLVKDPDKYRDVTGQYGNVSYVSYDWATSEDEEKRDRYYRAICLAKYFFFTHACGFCRLPRKGQVRVQLWHGCGYKTVKNPEPLSEKYEYMTVVSRKYAELHEKEFGLRKEQLLVTGYPKEDWLFHPDPEWKTKLGIRHTSKYIIWLPTFRKARDIVAYMDPSEKGSDTGLPVLDTVDKLSEVNDILYANDAILIIKLHPLQKSEGMVKQQFSNIIMLTNEQLADADLHINKLLGDADALISDYSSAAVDYMILDRPIAYTLDDLEEYEKSRGFVLNPISDWLAGSKIFDDSDFKGFIKNVCAGIDDTAGIRRGIISLLHDFHDDGSSRRVIEALGI